MIVRSEFLITADEGVRGGKIIPLKKIADEALLQCPEIKKCVVVKRTGNQVGWNHERDVFYDEIISNVSSKCEPEEMSAEDPLFIYILRDQRVSQREFYILPVVIWFMRL